MQGNKRSDDERFRLAKIFYDAMWEDYDQKNSFPDYRPLLAHYTSLDTAEKIFASNEIWFSNPLCMNDYEELRFGLNEGRRALCESESLRKAYGSRFNSFVEQFNNYYNEFGSNDAINTFIFCLSLHDNEKDENGKLSMWRGYGGNGSGVAIVFDSSKLEPTEDSPILVGPVEYFSTSKRLELINKKLDRLAEVIINERAVLDDDLNSAAFYFFSRLKLFSLFTKHNGFFEEKEWRVVYDYSRDRTYRFSLNNYISYSVTPYGVRPVLKLNFTNLEKLTGQEFELDKLIDKIILGPTHHSEFNITAFKKMLEKLEKISLIDKISASSIPFRP